MDTPKNQKITKPRSKPFFLKQQILNNLIKLLINYTNAQSQESIDKNFQLFKNEFLKQKKAYPLLDVNQPIGISVSFGPVICKDYFGIVLLRDDLPFFKLLLECGLNDVTINGEIILQSLILSKALKCLKEFLTVGDFARHFQKGKYNPIESAVKFHDPNIQESIEELQNIDILKLLVEHPSFKKEYLNYEGKGSNLNPLLLATTNFNYQAVKYLLEQGAPCASTVLPLKGFDLAYAWFLNYFSGGHASELDLGKKMPNPFIHKAMMTPQNIMRVFYLLLNNTPHEENLHQLIQDENNSDKVDVFRHLNELLEKNIKIKESSLKFLLDILAGVGSGLFFHDWPQLLKDKYKNVPPSAEIVMPIMSVSGQVTRVFYYFADLEAYLENHHTSFQILKGLHRYLQNKILIIKTEHSNYGKAIQLAEKLTFYVNLSLPGLEFAPEPPKRIDNKPLSLLNLLSELIDDLKEPIVNADNLSPMLKKHKCEIESVIIKMPDEKSILANEQEQKSIDCILECFFSSLPSMYQSLITLNQIYRQLFALPVKKKDHGLVKESITLFNNTRNKIDFYSMQWLYFVLHVQNIAPDEIIKLVQVLSTIFELIDKNTRINDQISDRSAYYRLQYLIQTLLVDAYSKTNDMPKAKKAFKQALLVLQAANKPALFKGAYTTNVHHAVLINGFLNMMRFGMTHMPDRIHAHLCQIIQYETGMALSDQVIHIFIVYLKNEINRHHFIQVNELLDFLQKNLPQNKQHMLFNSILDLKVTYHKYLQMIQSLITKQNLNSQVKLNIFQQSIEIDFKACCLGVRAIRHILPFECKVNEKIVNLTLSEVLFEADMQSLILAIQEINALDVQKKQSQEMQALQAKMDKVTITESSTYIPYHSHCAGGINTPKKVKPIKSIQSDSHDESPPCIPKKNVLITKKINVIKLKKLAGLGDDYSDLIMIYSSYSINNRKFVAIKKSPEFEKFLNASYLFKNDAGEWSVNSINPYGKNQHGIKYEKKLIGEKEVLHIAKLKASGSDRAIGYGKEIDYEGTKIIVYVIDNLLPHKKAEKIFRLT